MPYSDVLEEMAVQTRRKLAAYEAIATVSDEPGIDFTGTTITVDELTTHSRSEAALHRWDLIGDDALADDLLADPDLTAHTVKILNRMPTLAESARSIAARAAAHRSPRIVVRAPGWPDVALDTAGHGRVELGGSEPLDADLTITTDPANRLLALWGRRSTHRPIDIDGPAQLAAGLDAIRGPTPFPGHQHRVPSETCIRRRPEALRRHSMPPPASPAPITRSRCSNIAARMPTRRVRYRRLAHALTRSRHVLHLGNWSRGRPMFGPRRQAADHPSETAASGVGDEWHDRRDESRP